MPPKPQANAVAKAAITSKKAVEKQKRKPYVYDPTFQMHRCSWTLYKEPTIKTDMVGYYCYQKEICPTTGRDHWQGYLELLGTRKLVGQTLKDQVFLDQSVHIEPSRGTQEQNIIYCSKLESKIGDFVEWGEKKKQGARSDLDEIAALAPTYTARKLVAIFGGNALRHIHMIKTYQKCIYNPDLIDRYIELERPNPSRSDFRNWSIGQKDPDYQKAWNEDHEEDPI